MSDPTRAPSDPLGGYTSPPPPGASGFPSPTGYDAPAIGQWQLAGWWRRVGAQVIDGIVLSIAALVLLLVLLAVFGSTFLVGDTAGIIAIILSILLWMICVTVVSLFYAPVMMDRTNGQTLGRMALGIRVVRTNGKPMDFGWSLLREFVVKGLLFNVIGSFTLGLAPLIDVLWPLWDEENRALHDFIVETRTIRT